MGLRGGRLAVLPMAMALAVTAGAAVDRPAELTIRPVVAPAPVPLDGRTAPALGSWGDGGLDLFVRDPATGRLAHRRLGPGPLATWSGAGDLGGGLRSQPAVASWGPGRYDVVVRGTDDQLWHRWFTGGRWSRWEDLGGTLTSAPAVAASGAGRLDVFARGRDGGLWTRAYVSGRWTDWHGLGGDLASAPAVTGTAGRLHVVVRGPGDAVWHRWRTATWSRWESLGGRVAADPAISAPRPGTLDVFARGAGAALWVRHYRPGAGWSGWSPLAGVLTSGPGAAADGSGTVAVAVAGTGGRWFVRRWTGRAWAGWGQVDPAAAFRRLGAWVDTLDYPALDPARAVADLRRRGVSTLYLSTARFNGAADFRYPAAADAWLAAAHAAGLRVVGWYVPDYADLDRDVRRTVAVAEHVSPAGHRFDAIGVDVEYPLAVPDPDAWNAAVGEHLRRVRAGTLAPIGAIVFPPALMRAWSPANRWTTFPWPAVARYADAVLPMSYWTSFTPGRRCAGGNQRWCVDPYTRANVTLSRQLTRLPVHVIGGVGDVAGPRDVAAFVAAARATGAAGGSLYDYRTTTSRVWPVLYPLASLR